MTETENMVHAERLKHLEESDKKQWDVLDKLSNRLPVWATLFISTLTFLTGCTLTWALIAENKAEDIVGAVKAIMGN